MVKRKKPLTVNTSTVKLKVIEEDTWQQVSMEKDKIIGDLLYQIVFWPSLMFIAGLIAGILIGNFQ